MCVFVSINVRSRVWGPGTSSFIHPIIRGTEFNPPWFMVIPEKATFFTDFSVIQSIQFNSWWGLFLLITQQTWKLTHWFPLSRKDNNASHGCFLSGGTFHSWSTAWSVWVIRGWLDESACGGRVLTGMGFGGGGASEAAGWLDKE